MPNWCSTTYYIDSECAAAMKENLEKREKSGDSNWNWLGHFVSDFGGDVAKVYSRGWVDSYEYNEENKELTLYCSTAWAECNEWREFIESKFEGLCIFYSAEEPGLDYYVTNIEDFAYPYTMETEEGHDDFSSPLDLLKAVCRECDMQMPECREEDAFALAGTMAEAFNEQQENRDSDRYVYIHKYDYIED